MVRTVNAAMRGDADNYQLSFYGQDAHRQELADDSKKQTELQSQDEVIIRSITYISNYSY